MNRNSLTEFLLNPPTGMSRFNFSSSEDLPDEGRSPKQDRFSKRRQKLRNRSGGDAFRTRLPWWIDSFNWEYFFLSRREYEHLIDEIIYQYTISKKKLQSKREALLVVANDLEVCMKEREQLSSVLRKYLENCECPASTISKIDPKSPIDKRPNCESTPKPSSSAKDSDNELKFLEKYAQDGSKGALGTAVKDLIKQRSILREEVETLNQRLKDSNDDIKLLRQTVTRQRTGNCTVTNLNSSDENQTRSGSVTYQLEEALDQLEIEKSRVSELEMELVSCKDSLRQYKSEKDFFLQRSERLNRELNYLLSNESEKSIVDIDALTLENEYLKQQIKQVNAEKGCLQEQYGKLKQSFEEQIVASNATNSSVKTRSVLLRNSLQAIKSLKHIREYLWGTKKHGLPVSEKVVDDLHGLASTLVECLDDKNVALVHQRNTNKALGERVRELERKLKTLENSGLWSTTERERRLDVLREQMRSRRDVPSMMSPSMRSENSFDRIPSREAMHGGVLGADRRSPSVTMEFTDDAFADDLELFGFGSDPVTQLRNLSTPLDRLDEVFRINETESNEDLSQGIGNGIGSSQGRDFSEAAGDDHHRTETPMSGRRSRNRMTPELN
ncbi:uncharacterized protein LOC142345676 [Convolutriloba macropyga]|uniref:uncharacterized protein LOC142345676 n=1 Tax=Convolutriloba macropyga TaxID=536237 RepID=UPI003F5262EB